jgi:hypothetical protein
VDREPGTAGQRIRRLETAALEDCRRDMGKWKAETAAPRGDEPDNPWRAETENRSDRTFAAP